MWEYSSTVLSVMWERCGCGKIFPLVFSPASTVAAITFLKRSWPPSGALLCVSAVGMLVLGGWVLAGSARMDTILYGRYIGPWAVPLTVVGLAAVCRGAVTRRLVMALSVSTLAAALLTAAISSQVTDPGRRIMTLGLGFFWHVFDVRMAHGRAARVSQRFVTRGRRGFCHYQALPKIHSAG